ncbi:MAG: hypothetical protein F9K34_07675 [Albidovulum sp.]|uniref:hypothetical protein n=1 Tax=Albidovulum sp. TaxID=1872424 RepID=UPI00132783DE|nr:hypothetical protein [Defluviimonas sp.]KAB2884781.1 MAG: hypothetical protein F9K34_07675 [Defluviimonas sp.]
MSMKSLAVAMPGTLMSVLPVPASFRIAVPAWRTGGGNTNAEPVAEVPTLSREEIQSLFHGELADRVRRRSALTVREEQERSLARRIRAALYPSLAATFVRH